tara:strand:+ start:285 stop:539 length:255 start_codon:yes stop_codon:yes gene_type:complete
MTLTKETFIDKIEIVGEFKAVQVRTATIIKEDETELSRSFDRRVISAGDDYSSETAEVQAICSAVHTDAVVQAYADFIDAMQDY